MHINHLPGVPGGDDDAQFQIDPTPEEAAALAAKDDDGAGKTQADLDAEREQQERQEAEAAEAAEAARIAAEAAAAEAAKATPPGDAPAAPEDFKAAREKAEADMDAGLLSTVEFQRELDRIRDGQAQHDRALAEHEATVARWQDSQRTIAEAKAANDAAWESDYNAFAKDNAEFMANPLYVRDMQTVIDDILKGNPAIDNAKLLSEAYDKVAKYHRYEKPAPQGDAILDALKSRSTERPGQTLGDAPAARSETITGNETFDALDRMPIGELEDVVAGMSGPQLEKYLAAAPGANATGRD